MASKIDTKAKRDRLEPRREPYWAKIQAGAYLGYRRADDGGTWIARFRTEDGKQRYSALELPPNTPQTVYDLANAEARKWFAHVSKGGAVEGSTVKTACEQYVDQLKRTKGEKPSADVKARFKRWVYSDDRFSRLELLKLQKSHLLDWRRKLTDTEVVSPGGKKRARSASALNRDMTALRAALNYAMERDHITTDHAWKSALKPIKDADGRRELYLDRTQRRKLIKAAPADVAAYLTGLSLLPLRPGALAALVVGNFDKRLRTLTIGKDKNGSDRRIALPDATADFLVEQSRKKLPAAPLLARADGSFWNKDSWKQPVKDAAAAAKLSPAVTAYTLRHSVITDLIHGGLDSLTVAQLSGTSIAMIERHYGHLTNEHARKALAMLKL